MTDLILSSKPGAHLQSGMSQVKKHRVRQGRSLDRRAGESASQQRRPLAMEDDIVPAAARLALRSLDRDAEVGGMSHQLEEAELDGVGSRHATVTSLAVPDEPRFVDNGSRNVFGGRVCGPTALIAAPDQAPELLIGMLEDIMEHRPARGRPLRVTFSARCGAVKARLEPWAP
jgi:hypothetical protein